MSKKIALATTAFLIFSFQAQARSYLFYLEAQTVVGYSSTKKSAIFFSLSQKDAMQKPSLGFDYIHRLSGETRDFGAFALQVRLAYNHETEKKIELQIYNAYFKYKAGFADLWAGHNRPAFGLSSALDSHALLLPTLAMMGYGFDRDWGLGLQRDFDWGNFSASLTTGSGMPLYFKGNYLASLRISQGILAKQNHNLGLSLAYGKILETMGYELMKPDSFSFQFVSMDWTYLWTRFESRVEIMLGKKMKQENYILFWRLGMNFFEENRLKFELQPIFWKEGEASNYLLSAGLSYQLSTNLALRSMYQYDHDRRDRKIVFQVYYYKGL